MSLAEITRPDGRAYRPRKLAAHAVTDPDDTLIGVVVLGTHDPAKAVWWRDGFACGRRGWIDDPVAGRAGIWYQEIVELYP